MDADVEKFRADQPRDSHGRWAATGGGDMGAAAHRAAGGAGHALAPRVHAQNPKVTAAVNHLIANAHDVEPSVTANLQRIASSSGGHLEGLAFKFKSPAGILEKVGRKSRDKNTSPEKEAGKIGDVLRYTMVVPAANHTAGVLKAIGGMRHAGYTVRSQDIENHWEHGDSYQGINIAFHHPNGTAIEMQFHTPESWHVKNDINHGSYEKLRSTADMPKHQQHQLYAEMRRTSDEIPVPQGITAVGHLVHRPFR